MRMVFRFVFASFLLVITLAFPALAETIVGKCIAAYDGDTITVQVGSKKEKIRLIGIDTPEMGQKPWGEKARDFTRSLVLNKTVTVKTDVEPRDRYGRLLGYVYVDGKFVNLEIIKNGYAMLLTYPPNVAHTKDFTEGQRYARERGLNVWHQANGLKQTPKDYRHKGDGSKRAVTSGKGMQIVSQPKQTQQAAPGAADGRVSLNTRSLKFHKPSCRYYDCKNCQTVSLSEAQSRGGVPGKCCH